MLYGQQKSIETHFLSICVTSIGRTHWCEATGDATLILLILSTKYQIRLIRSYLQNLTLVNRVFIQYRCQMQSFVLNPLWQIIWPLSFSGHAKEFIHRLCLSFLELWRMFSDSLSLHVSPQGHNIFSNLSSTEYSDLMQLLKQSILATDLTLYFEYVPAQHHTAY